MLNSFRTHEETKALYTANEAARIRTAVEGFSFTAALAAKRARASQDAAFTTQVDLDGTAR